MANPYIRILRAYEKGVGVRLSAEEVRFMRFDSAIETQAGNTLAGDIINFNDFTMDKNGIHRRGGDHG